MYSTKNFSYLKESQTLMAEASELQKLQPAAPIGKSMIIKSERTGLEAEFVFDHLERDREGDIMVWVYTQSQAGPKVPINNVVVFND